MLMGKYRSCFCSYVETKCVKRMEAFRTRHSSAGQQRLLLLPLSLGLSSVAMLQLLESQLERQLSKSGRTGFSLSVLHLDTSAVDKDSTDATTLERVKERWPNYTYHSVPLSDAMALPDLEALLRQNNIESATSSELDSTSELSNEGKLSHFLHSLPSATSRADVTQILKTKLIISFAKSQSCEAILWGDTTTRLAEKTLSETAKGRGFGLAWAISDGPSPHGIDFYYPMRDLLKKELITYSAFTTPPLTDFIVPEKAVSTIVSAKNSSIDELMRGYFEGVEKNYPSIVANVVRTTGRLQVPGGAVGNALNGTEGNINGEPNCGLCGLPIISAAGEDGFAVKGVQRHGIQFCHGCARSFPLSSA